MLKTAEASVQAAARSLRAARRVVVTSGAGMSRDSGIPTFRDALTGLWARYDPQELATGAALPRRAAPGGERRGVGLERALRRDAGGGDLGAGATGGATAARGARSGGRGDRGQSRPHRDFPRGAHHLPRAGRRGAAGAARGAHGRGTSLIRRT